MSTESQAMPTSQIAPLLSIEDTELILGVRHWAIRRLVKVGKLRGIRVGRRLMLDPESVRSFIANGGS